MSRIGGPRRVQPAKPDFAHYFQRALSFWPLFAIPVLAGLVAMAIMQGQRLRWQNESLEANIEQLSQQVGTSKRVRTLRSSRAASGAPAASPGGSTTSTGSTRSTRPRGLSSGKVVKGSDGSVAVLPRGTPLTRAIKQASPRERERADRPRAGRRPAPMPTRPAAARPAQRPRHLAKRAKKARPAPRAKARRARRQRR